MKARIKVARATPKSAHAPISSPKTSRTPPTLSLIVSSTEWTHQAKKLLAAAGPG